MNFRVFLNFSFKNIRMKILLVLLLQTFVLAQIPMHGPDKNQVLLNEPIDISGDFRNFSNTYYLADELSSFDPKSGEGKIMFKRYEYTTRQAFNNMLAALAPVQSNEFPSV